MKKKKYGFVLAAAAIYGLLSCAMLVSLTAAKYTDKRTAYTDFRVAQFNAAILLGNGTQEGTQVTQTVDLASLRPGLEGETALRIPFRVSNGTNEENASEAGVKYTVQVLTPQNLPLVYALEVVQDGETVTYQMGEPEAVEKEEDSLEQSWYRYTFQLDTPEEVPEVIALAQELETDEGEDPDQEVDSETATEPEVENQEAEFLLDPALSGVLTENQHTLVIQWPTGAETDVKYIKEVEPIHILVTAHSINRPAEDESYNEATIPAIPQEDTYTPGLVVLKNGVEKTTYELDLRAFHLVGETRSFELWVDNGFGMGQIHTQDRVPYRVSLKAPLKKVGDGASAAWQLLDLQFQMDGYVFQVDHYIIIDEKTGDPVTNGDGGETLTYNAVEDIPELGAGQRPYAVYACGFADTLVNAKPNDIGQAVFGAARNVHTMALSGSDAAYITDDSLNDEFSFQHKLELIITASYTGVETPEEDT